MNSTSTSRETAEANWRVATVLLLPETCKAPPDMPASATEAFTTLATDEPVQAPPQPVPVFWPLRLTEATVGKPEPKSSAAIRVTGTA